MFSNIHCHVLYVSYQSYNPNIRCEILKHTTTHNDLLIEVWNIEQDNPELCQPKDKNDIELRVIGGLSKQGVTWIEISDPL